MNNEIPDFNLTIRIFDTFEDYLAVKSDCMEVVDEINGAKSKGLGAIYA